MRGFSEKVGEKTPRATGVYTSNCVKTRKVTKAIVENRSQGTVSADSWQSIILTTPALSGPIILETLRRSLDVVNENCHPSSEKNPQGSVNSVDYVVIDTP